MIIVCCPNSYVAERQYLLQVVFKEFLGLDYAMEVADRDTVGIRLMEMPNVELTIADTFFGSAGARWLHASSLPSEPLRWWDVSDPLIGVPFTARSVPVLYGVAPPCTRLLARDGPGIHLNLDVLGSAFFLLSRYEEVVSPVEDRHERFPAGASLAARHGFLERPVVNEYVEILWAAMRVLWPSLRRVRGHFEVRLSHDVDTLDPLVPGTLLRLTRAVGGDLVKRRDPRLAAGRVKGWFGRLAGGARSAICNLYADLMEISETYGLRSSFYFLVGRYGDAFDCDYELAQPAVGDLLRLIHQRGHEIGLHGSYHSWLNTESTRVEFMRLLKVCEGEGIQQSGWGGRQHYLRWRAPDTWRVWNDAGLDYDSSVGFADRVGFRCGTCYEYPVYDLVNRRPLGLRERPLAVMDATVLSAEYMHLTGDAALTAVLRVKDACKTFAGQFNLLWHGNSLVDDSQAEILRAILAA